MLALRSDEQLVMVVRRHWWSMASTAVAFFLLLIAPSAVFAAGRIVPQIALLLDDPLSRLAISMYFLGLLLFAFLLWMEYYLDVWIITTRRIIDIDQKSLFHRVVSEIPLTRIQNITIDINGVIETFLKFGDINVETAGEMGSFTIANAPLPYEVKDAILEHVHQVMSEEVPIVTVNETSL